MGFNWQAALAAGASGLANQYAKKLIDDAAAERDNNYKILAEKRATDKALSTSYDPETYQQLTNEVANQYEPSSLLSEAQMKQATTNVPGVSRNNLPVTGAQQADHVKALQQIALVDKELASPDITPERRKELEDIKASWSEDAVPIITTKQAESKSDREQGKKQGGILQGILANKEQPIDFAKPQTAMLDIQGKLLESGEYTSAEAEKTAKDVVNAKLQPGKKYKYEKVGVSDTKEQLFAIDESDPSNSIPIGKPTNKFAPEKPTDKAPDIRTIKTPDGIRSFDVNDPVGRKNYMSWINSGQGVQIEQQTVTSEGEDGEKIVTKKPVTGELQPTGVLASGSKGAAVNDTQLKMLLGQMNGDKAAVRAKLKESGYKYYPNGTPIN